MKTNLLKAENTNPSDGRSPTAPSIPVIDPKSTDTCPVEDIAENDFQKPGVFQNHVSEELLSFRRYSGNHDLPAGACSSYL